MRKMSDNMSPEKPYKKSNSSPQVFIHIDENEKWVYIKISKANKISKNEKLEILKNIKNLINQFIDDKYNKIFIDFSKYLEMNKNEIDYLIHYNYNNLNDQIPENMLFHDFVDTYEYEEYKFLKEKCIKIDKKLEISFECGIINDEGNRVCDIYEINGTTEINDCT